VHVSHRDAAEYCQCVGARLPGEREWEAAARYGHTGPNNRTLYIWGDPIHSSNRDDDTNTTDLAKEWQIAAQHANLWGPSPFPFENDAHDQWRGTSPVKSYKPNKAGLYDMTGNVWEWMRGGKHKARIVRGASYVDSLDGSFNLAATLGARDTAHGTTTTGNIGFRCAKSPKRRVEHHWKWHDEEEEGVLAIEDQFGERRTIKGSSGGSGEGWEEEEGDDNDEFAGEKRKKKKVVKKRERLSTEL
jgi:formylglycine-generating enzyme required for sulfatase activity